MDYSGILNIEETSLHEYAQKLLSLGWILLGVASGRDSNGEPHIVYSLGWQSEKGDPVFPSGQTVHYDC